MALAACASPWPAQLVPSATPSAFQCAHVPVLHPHHVATPAKYMIITRLTLEELSKRVSAATRRREAPIAAARRRLALDPSLD